jgi:hypothetical protein
MEFTEEEKAELLLAGFGTTLSKSSPTEQEPQSDCNTFNIEEVDSFMENR